MRHVDYREPAPYRFVPLARSGNRNVGSWWRTRDGHFLLQPASASWSLRGRDQAETAWLASVGLWRGENGLGWPQGPFFPSIAAALLALADALREHPPAEPFPDRRCVVRWRRNGDGWVSVCGHWAARRDSRSVWLSGASEAGRQLLDSTYSAVQLPNDTLAQAAACASRMLVER